MAKCIYKSDALNVIAKLINENKRLYDTSFHKGKRAALIEALEEIEKIKGADVQPIKRGRWSECYTDSHHYSGICTVCGKASIRSIKENPLEYCPKCGARMDGGNEDENSI